MKIPISGVAFVILLTSCGGLRVPDDARSLSASEGFTLAIAPFEVPAGGEAQDCHFFTVPDLDNGKPIWANRFYIGNGPGTHHTQVYRVRRILGLDGAAGQVVRGGECWKPENWADWPLVANAQPSSDSAVDWTMPPRVAIRFEPGEKLMVQTHHVNDAKEPMRGTAIVNMFKSPETSPTELGALSAPNPNIRVCRSDPTVAYRRNCAFQGPGDVQLVAASGELHPRGVDFEIHATDGTVKSALTEDNLLYRSRSWEAPLMSKAMDTEVAQGTGVSWTCAFQWKPPAAGCAAIDAQDPQRAGDCCYTVGSAMQSSEACTMFLYYWPKLPEGNIACK